VRLDLELEKPLQRAVGRANLIADAFCKRQIRLADRSAAPGGFRWYPSRQSRLSAPKEKLIAYPSATGKPRGMDRVAQRVVAKGCAVRLES